MTCLIRDEQLAGLPDDDPLALVTGQDWLWEGRLRRGGVTLLQAKYPGDAASLVLDLAARVSKGDGLPAGRVLFAKQSCAPPILAGRLAALGADLANVETLDGYEADWNEADRLLAADDRFRLVVADPFLWNGTSGVLDRVCRLADLRGVSVLLTGSVRPPARLAAVAETVLLLAPAYCNQDYRVLACRDSRTGVPVPSFLFRVDAVAGFNRLVPVMEAPDWSAEDLLGRQQNRRLEAAIFLCEMLKRGAIAAKKLGELAAERGIAMVTLRRAGELLRVRHIRDGFGPGSVLYWRLPDRLPAGLRLVEALTDQV